MVFFYNESMSMINIIGAACMDILISSVDRDTFFSGKQKVDTIRMYPGGDALNEALILSHFKADTKLISVLGDDQTGRFLLGHMKAENLAYNEDILKKKMETYLSLVMVDQNGERTFVGNRNGSLRKLDLSHIRIDEDAKIVCLASVFISEKLRNEELCDLFTSIKKKGKILCADCSTPKHGETLKEMDCLRYVDHFFCNETEAAALCETKDVSEMDLLFKEHGVNAYIKCGEKGCYHDGRYFHGTPLKHVVDTTGAGDSFAAGFLLSLSKGGSIEGCIRQGNEFGRKACEYLGATEWIKHEECA